MNERGFGARVSRRDLIRLSAMGLSAAALAACVPGTGAAPSGSAAVRKGGTLRIGMSAEPQKMDPQIAPQSTAYFTIWHQIWDTLLWFDVNGQAQPAAAQSWRTVDDLTWEFKLRPGLTFHNGEPLDANAVKFSIERILDPKSGSPFTSRFVDVTSIAAVDSTTVRVITKRPAPVLLSGFQQAWLVPPKYLADQGDKAFRNPVGSGAFKFKSWDQGVGMELVANESFYAGRPALDGLSLKFIPDAASRLSALKAGELDMLLNPPQDALDGLKADTKFKVYTAYLGRAQVVQWDSRSGPLKDKRVRQALNYAVDKSTIATTLLKGAVRPLEGQVLTEGTLGYDPSVKAFPFDTAKAKQLLSDAGYPNGFDFELFASAGNTVDRDTLLAIAPQLTAAGIRTKATVLEQALWATRLAASQLAPGTIINESIFGDPNNALVWFTSKASLLQDWNSSDPKQDDLIGSAASILDAKKREAAYFSVAEYMHDQASCLFLFQPASFTVTSTKVQGFVARGDDIVDLLSPAVGLTG